MRKILLVILAACSCAAMSSHALTASYKSSTAGGWAGNHFQTLNLPTEEAYTWRNFTVSDTNGYGQTFIVSDTFNVVKLRVFSIRHYVTNSVTVKVWKNIAGRPDDELSDTNNLVTSFEFGGTALNTDGSAGDILEIALDESEQFELSPLAGTTYYIQFAATATTTNTGNLMLLCHTDVNEYPDGGYAIPGGAIASDRDLGIAFVSDSTPGLSELAPVADTHIRYGTNQDNNYGGGSTLDTRQNDEAPRDFVSYIRFDLSSITGPITNATFTVTREGGDSLVPERVRFLGLDNVAGNTAQDWDEYGLTWNTAGAEVNTSIYPAPAAGASPFYIPANVTDFEAGTSNIVESAGGSTASISGSALADWLESRRNNGGLATLIIDFPAGETDKQVRYWSRDATNETAVAPLLTLLWDTNAVVYTYDEWITDYPGVGSETNRLDDSDSDGRDNINEYAFGGDPSVNDAGNPASFNSDASWIYYVYPKRANADAAGLTYTIALGSGLTGSWVSGVDGVDFEELGTGDWPGDSVFSAVSNRVPIDADTIKFIRAECTE